MNETELIQRAMRHGWEMVTAMSGRTWLCRHLRGTGRRVDLFIYPDGTLTIRR